MSQDKQVEAFKTSMETWSKQMADNKDGTKFGYIDIEGIDLQAYGTPYAA